VLRRMANLPLARAFAFYHEHAKEQKRLRAICNRILRHWTYKGAAVAFDAWLQVLLSTE
jgi:hypothetical protein